MKSLLYTTVAVLLAVALRADPFTVVVYNVENLFDVDGEALFEGYQPNSYTRAHFLTKLQNTAEIMAHFNGGRGPDVILFQELEGDRTPELWDGDLVGFLTEHTGTPVEELLGKELPDELAEVPAYAWLYKKLVDSGMHEYFVAVADGMPEGTAHVNATFSRFPIREQRTHHSPKARGTLETILEVNGHPLHLFNCHWKSGASNDSLEPIRVENARVVRDRIDEILEEDPHADIVVGGDLNSHYNHDRRRPGAAPNGINDTLGSQGDELALRRAAGRHLYNLWFELPEEKRGSDAFRGEWGTLMHIILSRGLYDHNGIQYVDNSFRRAIVPGRNADPVTGVPIRWTFVGNGGGYSDHFPLEATFRVVPDDDPGRFIDLKNPSRRALGPSEGLAVDYADADLDKAPEASRIAEESALKGPEFFGRVLRVRSEVSGEFPFRVTVGGEELHIWAHDVDFRVRIYEANTIGDTFDFYGELGRHGDKWQFVIHDESWVHSPLAAPAP